MQKQFTLFQVATQLRALGLSPLPVAPAQPADLYPALYWLNTPYQDVYLFEGGEPSPSPRKPRRCCISACYNEPILFDPENLGSCTTHVSQEAIAA